MKIRFYILTCLLFGGLVSCNDWLDVKPETEMTLEEMYADQQGFQDALTGAYLNMKSTGAYGQQLMYGTVEYLAQHWDCSANSTQEKISQFNYVDNSVQSSFETIYTQLYKIIASANMILEQIDARQDVFEPGMYEIIKGEALAMRAYCHFDLLRLFGPMPTRTSTGKILPYVTTVGIDYHTHHTYQEFTELLKNDLIDAEGLLKQVDPIIPAEKGGEELNLSVSAENFLLARQVRFNYYAVKAMEARFFLWMGGETNKSAAYDCATELTEAEDSDGKLLFTLGSTDNLSKSDYSFSTEHILAIYEYNLKDRAESAFTTNSSYSKAQNVLSPDLYPAGMLVEAGQTMANQLVSERARNAVNRKGIAHVFQRRKMARFHNGGKHALHALRRHGFHKLSRADGGIAKACRRCHRALRMFGVLQKLYIHRACPFSSCAIIANHS